MVKLQGQFLPKANAFKLLKRSQEEVKGIVKLINTLIRTNTMVNRLLSMAHEFTLLSASPKHTVNKWRPSRLTMTEEALFF